MAEELLCNFGNCRKPLTANAYITVCSHAFCEDHGASELISKQCPACQTALVKSYDIVKANLNPSDQFNYQQYQENLHQELIIKTLKENIETLTAKNNTDVSILQAELDNMNRRQKEMEKALEQQKLKTDEVSEKLAEKSREALQYQTTCESLKKKQLSVTVLKQQQEQLNRNRNTEDPEIPHLGPQVLSDFQNRQDPVRNLMPRATNYHSSLKRNFNDFDFRPQLNNNNQSPLSFIENGRMGKK